MVAGLTGPARTLCMRMEANDLHPAAPAEDDDDYAMTMAPFNGQANAYRNSIGLDNVLQVLSTSPLVKKLPARKNELLHSFFRDDSLARRLGEPVTTWLVRYEEMLGKLKRVNIDLQALLPDIAGWQALNMAGLNEDRLERIVSKLPDDSYPLDRIQEELNRVYATIHISERASSAPAIAPGRSWTSTDRGGSRPPAHAWRPQGRFRSTNVAARHYEEPDDYESIDDDDEEDDQEDDGDDDVDAGDLQSYVRSELEILATAVEGDLALPEGIDEAALESACLKLAELPEALAIVQSVRRGRGRGRGRGRSQSRGFSRGGSRGGSRPDRSRSRSTHEASSGSRPAQVGKGQRPGRPGGGGSSSLQSKIDKRKARSTCHDCQQMGHWSGDPQCPKQRSANVIERDLDPVDENEV